LEKTHQSNQSVIRFGSVFSRYSFVSIGVHSWLIGMVPPDRRRPALGFDPPRPADPAG